MYINYSIRPNILFYCVTGKICIPESETQAEMYEHAIDKLSKAGFYRYEVSNFSKQKNSESTHNKSYWQGSQYLAAGPGAHSRVVPLSKACIREERRNVADPLNWLKQVNEKGNGIRQVVHQDILKVLSEYIVTGLRTSEGVISDIWNIFYSEKTLFRTFNGKIDELIDADLLCLSEKRLKATEKGLNVIDSILPELLIILTKAIER